MGHQSEELMLSLTRLSRVLILVCLATVSASAQAADPFVGTWTLHVPKSNTTFKSGTTIVETVGDGIRTRPTWSERTARRITSRGRRRTTAGTIP